MKKFLDNFTVLSAVVLGFIFLIPFIVLEFVNRWRFNESFPVAVFTFTWILQIVFILLLTPIIKTFHSGKSLTKNPLILVLRVVGLVIIAYIWAGWIIDQWPCFMGVPNCD